MTDITTAASRRLSNRDDSMGSVESIARWGTLVPFLSISAQLALMFVLLRLFEIEPGSGLMRVLPLVFIGFVVHSALPLRLRFPFFVLLSMAGIAIVVGPAAGAVIILGGLLLIGVCHLPIAFSTRVLLLVFIGAALAAVRSGLLVMPVRILPAAAAPGLPRIALPVLASMFMFRLVIYMYDLRHEEKAHASGAPVRPSAGPPTTIWTRLGYFFLLPNVCFLLFPIVDYRTYRRTYYDSDARAIYQKGVWWICLGLIQLLLYRIVYYYLVPSAEDVQALGGIVRFMTSAYLIYLRVVGQFQIIIGILCLFGFNLPPAHRFFLLASSFTDFWRRARIDWKDFMVKVFYYPPLVPLQRRLGATPALIVATICVFFATWVLHSYQWFWMLGEFRLLGNDAVFWTVIGGCVLVNSLLEARKPRPRAIAAWSTKRAVERAAKTVGMFVFMCVLWSYWSSPSFAIWLSYLTAAKESGPGEYVVLVAALLAVIAGGVFAQFIAMRFTARPVVGAKPRSQLQPVSRATLAWRPATVFAAALLLLLLRVPTATNVVSAQLTSVASTLRTNALNDVDQDRQDRGYYETLLDVPRSTVALAASTNVLSNAAAGDATDEPATETAQTPQKQSLAASDSTSRQATAMAPAGDTIQRQPLKATGASTQATMQTAPAISVEKRGDDSVEQPGTAAAYNAAEPPLPAMHVNPRRGAGGRAREYERATNDMRLWENAPNFVGTFKKTPFRTNRWGMRDKDYSLARPPNTTRIALLGTSMTVGAGVPLEQTMETLIEERLNRDGPGAPRRHYEILNFSVGGYGILQNVEVLEKKALSFRPNGVLIGIFSVESGRMSDYLVKLVQAKVPIEYAYVRMKLQQAGVTADMERPELLRRLAPLSDDLVRWSYSHMMEVCKAHGVTAVGVVLPEPRLKAGHNIKKVVKLARAAGLPLLDLGNLYEGQDVDSLRIGTVEGVGQNDPHWNERGHKLVADKIYEALRDNDADAFKLGFSPER